VSACLRGDETAWAAIVQRYRRLIYTIPLRFGMPPAAAEEIFQDLSATETRCVSWGR